VQAEAVVVMQHQTQQAQRLVGMEVQVVVLVEERQLMRAHLGSQVDLQELLTQIIPNQQEMQVEMDHQVLQTVVPLAVAEVLEQQVVMVEHHLEEIFHQVILLLEEVVLVFRLLLLDQQVLHQ
tara:strand:- start:225 stop:593 length:369 start_codon:yes stop_codon:yes gene_type:complete